MANNHTQASAKVIMRRFITALFCFAMIQLPAGAQDLNVPFVDEAPQDVEFLDWRTQLAGAVAARDANAVASMAAPDIVLSGGGEGGRQTLRAWLEGRDTGRGETYWAELASVLALGGRFEGPDRFTAPYTWGVETPSTLAPFETYFVIGLDVPVYQDPSEDSPLIASLSETVVRVPPQEAADDAVFCEIELSDGRKGFVRVSSLRALVGFRAVFERSNGSWQLTAFRAGL